ncbi:uncharacterized protein LOC118349168 [Juglans regia]|nr:uncharacterized protein LOC108980124 [Juglans regia]XP_018806928.2 uncharacterized protein LOC108980455 [Juglans regia]XP_018810440.2 uncharacterized protein LOC108983306 [Juglans regia]XP_035548617.1 uncharacterized protein LOC118349168 [Juglans regia]
MLKPPMPSYSEVVPLLQGFETRSQLHENYNAQHTAFYGHATGHGKNKGRPWSSRGRGFSQATQVARPGHQHSQHSGPKNHGPHSGTVHENIKENNRIPTCQICGKQGHTAIKCWHRFDHAVQPNDIPQALAAMTLENNIHDTEWTADTGASAHMTGNSGKGDQPHFTERPTEG